MVQNVQNTKTQKNIKAIIKLNNQKTKKHERSKEGKRLIPLLPARTVSREGKKNCNSLSGGGE